VELVLKLFASAIHVRAGREEGQTMAEYGVILAVVTLAVVASLAVLSGGIWYFGRVERIFADRI